MNPPGPKKTNPLLIVLAVIGVLGILGVGTCVVGGILLSRAVSGPLGDAGGAVVLTTPAAVVAELGGAKKDYVGSWRSAKGSTLDIRPDGNLSLAKREGGATSTFNGPIAAFRGNDVEMKVFMTITLRVSAPPKYVTDHWEMTVDGIAFERK